LFHFVHPFGELAGFAGLKDDDQEGAEGREKQSQQTPQSECVERETLPVQVGERQEVHDKDEENEQEVQAARVHELIVQGWRAKGKK
jgi:hypothetical protein